jgi:hypothetical protein
VASDDRRSHILFPICKSLSCNRHHGREHKEDLQVVQKPSAYVTFVIYPL